MSVLDRYNAWRKRSRSANRLRLLSDRELADIGVRRDQIDDYVSRKLGE